MSDKDRKLVLRQLKKAREEGDKMVFEIIGSAKEMNNLTHQLPEDYRSLISKLVQDIIVATGKQDIISQRIEKVKKFLSSDDNKIDIHWRLDDENITSQSEVDKFFD